MTRRLRTLALAALMLALLGLFAAGLLWRVARPEAAVLVSRGGVPWIWRQEAPDPRGRALAPRTLQFRRRFFVAMVPPSAPAWIESLRAHRARLNGRPLPVPESQPGGRGRQRVDLAPYLVPGSNELMVTVENDRGPPALWLRAEAVELATGPGWEVSADGRLWESASPAHERGNFGLNRSMSSPAAFARVWPWLLACFASGCAGAWLARRERLASRPAARWLLDPARLRWAALVAWGLLAAHNLFRLPLRMGFDVMDHVAYVAFLLAHGRVPFAHEGLQMFQPPLFYGLAAVWQGLLSVFVGPDAVARLMRVLPMLCGLAQVELCYRAGRLAFPGRQDLQRLALTVGGFLPVNVYMSQFFGNEPLSGLLTAAMLLLCMHFAASTTVSPKWAAAGIGILFGLSLLTKVTVALLAPVVVLLLLAGGLRRGLGAGASAGLVGRFAFGSLAIAGWYYARNLLYLGRPFVGGWDPDRGFAWWQYPGYRLPSDVLRFGEALLHPVRIGDSFWDGLYSTLWLDGAVSGMVAPLPPWNHDFMLSMALLSFPLTLALLIGALRAVRWPRHGRERILAFSLACLASLLAGMLVLFFEVPTWSTTKSSYALGVLPCFALLVAYGLDPALRHPTGRALVAGYVTCWWATGYAAFWAV